MPKLETYRVTLEITIDTEVSFAPTHWNWYDVLDLNGEDDVAVVSCERVNNEDRES